MEKFGVDQDSVPGEKKAGDQKSCPKCGKTLIKHGSLRLCPMHGSLPFERPDDKNR